MPLCDYKFKQPEVQHHNNMAASFLFLTILSFQLLLISADDFAASGHRLQVCSDAVVTLDECSNCCTLEPGCIYLEPGTGSPVCLGGTSPARACLPICLPPKIKVCPSRWTNRIPISVLPPGKEPSNGCHLYNLKTGAPLPNGDDNSCLKDAVEICGGTVHPWKPGSCATCCTIPQGCMDLGHGKSVCVSGPGKACTLECGFASYVCPGPKSVALDFNSCHTCKKPLREGCKLYNRQGHQLCVKEDDLLQLA
ncbi:uncharacterized protein LOC9647732 [Selaginella moellendorffii]|nr:uncharacterized protein LOC9647732 [Selaginella moellendorffii]|eukprot:XP_002980466.2 uncharacterized protein LOC9647732 [Selaginella moellendorffii]